MHLTSKVWLYLSLRKRCLEGTNIQRETVSKQTGPKTNFYPYAWVPLSTGEWSKELRKRGRSEVDKQTGQGASAEWVRRARYCRNATRIIWAWVLIYKKWMTLMFLAISQPSGQEGEWGTFGRGDVISTCNFAGWALSNQLSVIGQDRGGRKRRKIGRNVRTGKTRQNDNLIDML